MIPYAGVSFMTYESLKEWCLTNEFVKPFAVQDAGLKASALLACGALSGAAAQTASYPFEVIRRHMQVAGIHHAPSQSSWKVAKEIFLSRGIRGLFVGLSIGYMKVTPMFAVSFYTYEWMQNIFR
jgi:solute carrier family 25 protein 16